MRTCPTMGIVGRWRVRTFRDVNPVSWHCTFGETRKSTNQIFRGLPQTRESEISIKIHIPLTFSGGHELHWERSDKGVFCSGCASSCCHCSPSSFWLADEASDSQKGGHKGRPRKHRNTTGHSAGSKKGRFRPYWKNYQ